MAGRSSALANAFVWAISMAAGGGILNTVVFHEKPEQVASDIGQVGGAAGAVAYFVRKERCPE